MRKRTTIVAGMGTLLVASAVSVGTYAVVNAQPNPDSQLPTSEAVAAKLDAIANPGTAARGGGSAISGEGPVPQVMDPTDGAFQDVSVTNTVLDVSEDGPDRAVVTRTMKYDFPNGESAETDPGRVPFVLESDGEWRIDREYLCDKVRVFDDLDRQDGFEVQPDPGCS
jgi:hypothetical protein